MEPNPENASAETRTAKEYYREFRDRVMVLCGKEGEVPDGRDFFRVESVGTLPNGLLVTGIFEHHRRERLRTETIRPATEGEIAARQGCLDGTIA